MARGTSIVRRHRKDTPTRSARIVFDRDQSGGGIPPRQPQNPAGLDSVASRRVPAVTSSQAADGEAGELPFPTLKA